MDIEITLTLPEGMVEHARRFGSATKRDVKAVLADALEMIWPMLGSLPDDEPLSPLTSLSDTEVLTFADAKMDPIGRTLP